MVTRGSAVLSLATRDGGGPLGKVIWEMRERQL